jgi:hypothetical protein
MNRIIPVLLLLTSPASGEPLPVRKVNGCPSGYSSGASYPNLSSLGVVFGIFVFAT